jgi:predicted DNA-binding transcriptional regulator YafY
VAYRKMSQEYKRITRLVKLLQMLQGERGKNCDELAKACGIGRRTIFRDLKTLRGAGVPLEFNDQTKRYSIPSETFGVPRDLTAKEVLSVWALANSVERHSHIPFYESLHTAMTKMRRVLPAPVRRKFTRMSKCIDFLPLRISHLAAKSADYRIILDAIESRRTLQMVYKAPTQLEPITTQIRPFKLIFSEHSWYVIGRSSTHSEVRTFNLLRIESLQLTNERFSIPKDFDWEGRIGNAWTMLPEPGRDNKVIVKFGPAVAASVAQVKWHKTQRTLFKPDGSLIFRATVSGLSEISWWIMRYGEHAEILHPAKLRILIARRLINMTAMYAETIHRLKMLENHLD